MGWVESCKVVFQVDTTYSLFLDTSVIGCIV